MKSFDLTLNTPAENLACDEALLDVAENGEADEALRFWEAREHFVVVGYANKVATEVNVAACESHGVPVLRRCSGGGTVLQGPGCLNYALVLRISDDNPLRNITAANQFIMERNRAALEIVLRRQVEVRGHTDLTIDGHKFSGNSQRRSRRFLLFHGTFLLNFDLTLVNELLPMPSKQPCYRKDRAHGDFLVNLNVSTDAVKAALRDAWRAFPAPNEIPTKRITALAAEKHGRREWNFKF
jgi:lipoate---protein ligase